MNSVPAACPAKLSGRLIFTVRPYLFSKIPLISFAWIPAVGPQLESPYFTNTL